MRVQINNFDHADQLKVISTYDINFNFFALSIKELQRFVYYPMKLMHTRMRVQIENFDDIDQLRVSISTYHINIKQFQ